VAASTAQKTTHLVASGSPRVVRQSTNLSRLRTSFPLPARDPGQLTIRALSDAIESAVQRQSQTDKLEVFIELAVEVGVCDAASVTMLDQADTTITIASVDDRATKADQIQYELDEGPCVAAARSSGVFVIQDVRAEERWPQWTSRVAVLGIGAALSVHLHSDVPLGSLNLYSSGPRSYGHVDLDTAQILATHTAMLMAQTRNEQHLWRAIDARNVIGQAQGILIERHHLTADQAFGVLRRYSSCHNIKIAAIAEQLVQTGKLPADPPGRGIRATAGNTEIAPVRRTTTGTKGSGSSRGKPPQ
jgi:hypothetical protein